MIHPNSKFKIKFKMKPIRVTILFAFLCIAVKAIAQKQSYNIVQIGEPLPDIEIRGVINYPTETIKTTEFKNKLLILDFWATWCGPCIASFPKLDSLQKQFNDKIRILPVTSEGTGKVKDFLQKMKSIKNISPTTATADTLLNQYFKHIYLPHYVWINNGNVIAITDGTEVNERNITKVIKGEKLVLQIKDDLKRRIRYSSKDIPTFAPSMELEIDETTELVRIPDSNLVFYSSITTYLEGLARGYHAYHPDIFTARNLSILELYRISLLENNIRSISNYPGAVIIEITDTTLRNKISEQDQKLKGLQHLDWLQKNGYCYDLKVPPAFIDRKFEVMVEDLNRYFGVLYGIEGVVESRSTKYLALIRTGGEDKLLSKGGDPGMVVDKFSVKIQNKKLSSLIPALIQPLQAYPFIMNETNYEGNVDLILNCELSSLKALNKELEKYGLLLQEKEGMFETPVIRKKASDK